MKIYQNKVSEKHNDSFWYDGLIAETDNAKLYATGEIRIFDGKGGVYDGKARDGFRYDLENDKDLIKMNEDNDVNWDMNNWFEVIGSDIDLATAVCDTYDEGIKELQKYYWNEIIK